MFAKNIRAENNIVVMVRPEGEQQGGSGRGGAAIMGTKWRTENTSTALQVTDTAALQCSGVL